MKLHIGGQERHPEWTILDTDARPEVDIVGSCVDLSRFADASVDSLYVSHVLEHVGHQQVWSTIRGWFRVLVPGGRLYVAVPDMASLARLFLDPASSVADKWKLMRMMYGGQKDRHDHHSAAFDEQMLRDILQAAGFVNLRRVQQFGIFNDTSMGRISPGDNPALATAPYSLNIIADKPPTAG